MKLTTGMMEIFQQQYHHAGTSVEFLKCVSFNDLTLIHAGRNIKIQHVLVSVNNQSTQQIKKQRPIYILPQFLCWRHSETESNSLFQLQKAMDLKFPEPLVQNFTRNRKALLLWNLGQSNLFFLIEFVFPFPCVPFLKTSQVCVLGCSQIP